MSKSIDIEKKQSYSLAKQLIELSPDAEDLIEMFSNYILKHKQLEVEVKEVGRFNKGLAEENKGKEEKITKLEKEKAELVEALEKCQMFINNGIEFGFIILPELASDTARLTPALINKVMNKFKEKGDE